MLAAKSVTKSVGSKECQQKVWQQRVSAKSVGKKECQQKVLAAKSVGSFCRGKHLGRKAIICNSFVAALRSSMSGGPCEHIAVGRYVFEGDHGETISEIDCPAELAADVEARRSELIEKLADVWASALAQRVCLVTGMTGG